MLIHGTAETTDNKICRAGRKIRIGQETGNTYYFVWPLTFSSGAYSWYSRSDRLISRLLSVNFGDGSGKGIHSKGW